MVKIPASAYGLGLSDSDAEDEPALPKRVKIDDGIKEGICLTPEAEDGSKKGKSLQRTVSWHDDFLTPYHEDHDINVLPLELLYIDGEPVDKILGHKSKLSLGYGTYNIQIVDAIFLPDANTGGSFKIRVDMIRTEPKQQFQSYIFNVLCKNRLRIGEPSFDGRRKVTQLKDFTGGEVPLGHFLDEVLENLTECVFDTLIFPDDEADDKTPVKPPAWRVEPNTGKEVAYADYNQLGDRLYKLKKSYEAKDRLKRQEELEAEHKSLRQAYIDYLRNWLPESPAKKKDLLSLRYRLVYLKEAYMMADKDPSRKYLKIPDLDETEVAHILKMEFDQLKNIYQCGLLNIKFITGSSTEVIDDMAWWNDYVGEKIYFDADDRRLFWLEAETDVRKAVAELHEDIDLRIDKQGKILLNGKGISADMV
jgi:hypothetical protein